MLAFEKKENYFFEGHSEIYGVTILEVGFKNVIAKVQYHDGMVAERQFDNNELSNLLEEY